MALSDEALNVLMAGLTEEFVEWGAETLSSVESLIEGRKGAGEDPMGQIFRLVHNMKGSAGTFGYPLISLIAHRLEDYIRGIEEPTAREPADILIFVDRMRDILDGKLEPDDVAADKIVRGLPVRHTFEVDDVTSSEVEVLLVMPRGTSARIVELELRACGYRVVTEPSALSAIGTVISAKPDVVIVAAVMPGMSGIDIACALSAMPTTREIPLALLTSLDAADALLRELPGHVPVIRKGEQFGDDLATALSKLGIT